MRSNQPSTGLLHKRTSPSELSKVNIIMSAGVSRRKRKKEKEKETREGSAWQRADGAKGNRAQRGNISRGIDAPVALLLRWITNNGVVSIYSRHTFRFDSSQLTHITHWLLPFGSVHDKTTRRCLNDHRNRTLKGTSCFCPCTLLNRAGIGPFLGFSCGRSMAEPADDDTFSVILLRRGSFVKRGNTVPVDETISMRNRKADNSLLVGEFIYF